MELVKGIKAVDAQRYPTLLKRIQSIFIDSVIIIASMVAISGVIDNFKEFPDWMRMVLLVMLLGVYEPLFISLGGTIGNRLMGIEVRKHTDESRRITLAQAYLRFITKILLGWFSFISIHMNRKRRAMHDIVAGSVMIQK